MTTLVGTQSDFTDALYELCELDYDAVETYEAAINSLENPIYIAKMKTFKADHERHVKELSGLLRKHQAKVPDRPSPKNLLAQGKVALANLIGDEAILNALLSNEVDTYTAYERLNTFQNQWDEAVEILKKSLEDERRHNQWLQTTTNGFKI
ncbi:MAG: DUF892 family protein [Tatlockia sp.]|nr:DUF892 family protein [Tatlockia sp.]